MEKVFVYGTLMSGFGNHRLIGNQDSEFIGEFKTHPEFNMLDLGYFPAIFQEGNTAIHGELWAVQDITPLDRLEGHPTHYERVQVNLQGYDAPVWTYVYRAMPYKDILSRCREVVNGNWGGRYEI